MSRWMKLFFFSYLRGGHNILGKKKYLNIIYNRRVYNYCSDYDRSRQVNRREFSHLAQEKREEVFLLKKECIINPSISEKYQSIWL
jgi:hypothetical protein